MKKLYVGTVAILVGLALNGCGGSETSDPTYSTPSSSSPSETYNPAPQGTYRDADGDVESITPSESPSEYGPYNDSNYTPDPSSDLGSP